MGLFNKGPKQPAVPATTGPDYTIDTVKDHLETIGLFRLRLRDADMKALLSVIAQNGMNYLLQQSPNGQPTGAQIVKLCKQLETVRRVMEQYGQIESRLEFAQSNTQELLAQGFTAVKGFADRLVSSVTPGGNANLTGYVVDTQILSM